MSKGLCAKCCQKRFKKVSQRASKSFRRKIENMAENNIKISRK